MHSSVGLCIFTLWRNRFPQLLHLANLKLYNFLSTSPPPSGNYHSTFCSNDSEYLGNSWKWNHGVLKVCPSCSICQRFLLFKAEDFIRCIPQFCSTVYPLMDIWGVPLLGFVKYCYEHGYANISLRSCFQIF